MGPTVGEDTTTAAECNDALVVGTPYAAQPVCLAEQLHQHLLRQTNTSSTSQQQQTTSTLVLNTTHWECYAGVTAGTTSRGVPVCR